MPFRGPIGRYGENDEDMTDERPPGGVRPWNNRNFGFKHPTNNSKKVSSSSRFHYPSTMIPNPQESDSRDVIDFENSRRDNNICLNNDTLPIQQNVRRRVSEFDVHQIDQEKSIMPGEESSIFSLPHAIFTTGSVGSTSTIYLDDEYVFPSTTNDTNDTIQQQQQQQQQHSTVQQQQQRESSSIMDSLVNAGEWEAVLLAASVCQQNSERAKDDFLLWDNNHTTTTGTQNNSVRQQHYYSAEEQKESTLESPSRRRRKKISRKKKKTKEEEMNKRNGRSSSKIMKKSPTSGDHSRINKKPKSRGERKPRTERRKKREDNTTVVGNQLASNNNGANEDKLEESISELLTVLEIKDPAKKRRSARLQKEKRKGKKAKKISSHTKPDESTNLDIHNNQRRRVSCSEDEDTGRI